MFTSSCQGDFQFGLDRRKDTHRGKHYAIVLLNPGHDIRIRQTRNEVFHDPFIAKSVFDVRRVKQICSAFACCSWLFPATEAQFHRAMHSVVERSADRRNVV